MRSILRLGPPLALAAVALAAVALTGASARAHVGGSVSTARFLSPPPLIAQANEDGGVSVQPWAFPTADASFKVSWEDGDSDPTGRFFFYYLDHAPSFQVTVDDIVAHATLIPEVAAGIWAGCDCVDGMGVVCPDAGVRDCRNDFDWDTSAIPPGAYWLIAVNRDPPFNVYSVSAGPVRIAHGGAPPPPAVIVTRPDGFGVFDLAYRAGWIASGAPPLRFDLAYGLDAFERVFEPTTPIADGVATSSNPDGTLGYDWDLGTVPGDQVYYLQVKVTDATGQSTYSHSRFGLSVIHPSDAGIPPADLGPRDGLGPMDPGGNGCGCDLGARRPRPSALGASLLLLLSAAVFGLQHHPRHRRRRS